MFVFRLYGIAPCGQAYISGPQHALLGCVNIFVPPDLRTGDDSAYTDKQTKSQLYDCLCAQTASQASSQARRCLQLRPSRLLAAIIKSVGTDDKNTHLALLSHLADLVDLNAWLSLPAAL